MPNAPNDGVAPRPKACDTCRQHKLRCDAHKNNYGPCSRCRRLRRNCVISNAIKKRNRQTKAQLEHEIDKLRAQYEQPSSIGRQPIASSHTEHGHTSSNLNVAQSSGNIEQPWRGISYVPNFPNDETIRTVGITSVGSGTDPQPVPSDIGQRIAWTSPQQSMYSNSLLTPSTDTLGLADQTALVTVRSPQAPCKTLGNIELSQWKINDCFSEFFEHYAPATPGIFDDDTDPDVAYAKSRFLFWAIVYIGSRKYAKDPTITNSLARPLHDLAHSIMFDPEQAISSIQAGLALCLWPLPINSTFTDPCHAMSGAVLHLAIQKGLPFASRKQDFMRVPLERSEKDRLFRSRLWVFCQMTVQRTNILDGLPCPVTIKIAQSGQNQVGFDGLSASKKYEQQLHNILINATELIVGSIDLGSNTDSDLLLPLIEHFDFQAQQVVTPVPSADDFDQFELLCVRLAVRCFHFFSKPDSARDLGMLQLYSIACEIISFASRLSERTKFSDYCNQSQARTISLAAVCILRLHHSHLRSQIKTQTGEDMFFTAIRMAKSRSIQNNDLDARNAIILTQLWSSTKIFKFKDGSIDGLRLLLRGRLYMSVLFDCLWWWRSEFGGTSNPYLQTESSQAVDTSPEDSSQRPRSTEDGQTFSMPHAPSTDLAELPDWLVNLSEVPYWQWDDGFNWGCC